MPNYNYCWIFWMCPCGGIKRKNEEEVEAEIINLIVKRKEVIRAREKKEGKESESLIERV